MSAKPPDDGLESRRSAMVTQAFDRELALEPDAMRVMNALCARLGAHLSRWIGGDGWHALLARALSQASSTGAARALALQPDATLRWTDESTSAQAPGACVRVLETVTDTLGRFIGAELALRLVGQGFAASDDQASGGPDHG